MPSKRNYALENERYKSKPKQVEKRVARNKARAILVVALGPAALRGKEVHHKDGNVKNNARSNLKPVAPATHNHGRKGAMGGKLKKG